MRPEPPQIGHGRVGEIHRARRVGKGALRPDFRPPQIGIDLLAAETLEGLEQLRFLENGRQVLCVEVEARGRLFWELNNPEDVPRLEAMLAEMGG